MNTRRIAALESRVAALFAPAVTGTRIAVDEAAGVLRDVAVMTIGPAKGHGFTIDATTLQQVHDLINARPEGARVRIRHPEVDAMTGAPKDGTATMVGRCLNCRIVGGQLRGDVALGDYAKALPGYGDARTYLLRLATIDPAAIGLSAVIDFDVEPAAGNAARVFDVLAVDFAEDPAANPRGLLSAIKTQPSGASPGIVPLSQGGPAMDLQELLRSLGLDPSGKSAEEVAAFVAGLTPEQQAGVTAAGYTDGWAPAAMSAPATPAAGAAPAAAVSAPAASASAAAPAAMSARAVANVATLETKRVQTIGQLAASYKLGDGFAQLHVGLGSTVEEFMTAARAEVARKYAPAGRGEVNVGEDKNLASLSAGISDGIRLRAGGKVKTPHERAREFQGRSLVGICRGYLAAVGIDTSRMGDHDAARLVFDRGRLAALGRAQLAHTTSDFSNILGDSINKSLRTAYEESPTTWEAWARRGVATDFKAQKRVQLSGAPDLERVLEAGEYKDGYFSDSGESFYLVKYGRIVTISWESMINDDLDAFNRIPTAMGQAAKRKEDDVVYYALLKNAAMGDTGLLFNATAVTTAGGHANLTTGAGAPSVSTLNAAVAAMAIQRAPHEPGKAVGSGPVLNLQPKHILLPPILAGTAWELLNSTSYAISNGNANIKNRFGPGGQLAIEPVIEPRLQNGVTLNGDTATGSSTAWYLAAANNIIDTMELAFLSSEPAPVTEEEDGFRVDGRSYKIRHTMQAKAIDHRGLYKHAGA